ncbi:MAG: hypothetical protein ACPGFC_08655 [Paracoccaceae bacterium]
MLTINGAIYLLNIYDRISNAGSTQAAAMIGFVIGSSIPPLLFWLVLMALILNLLDRKESGGQIKGLGIYIFSSAIAAAITSGGISVLLGAFETATAQAFAYAIAGALAGMVAFLVRRRFFRKQQMEVANVFAP